MIGELLSVQKVARLVYSTIFSDMDFMVQVDVYVTSTVCYRTVFKTNWN